MRAPPDESKAARGYDKLMPLDAAQSALLAIAARCASEDVPVTAAAGRILAQSVVAPASIPAAAIALRDGFAVTASETVGATPYAPVYAFETPQALGIGTALPEGADAVLPFSAIAAERRPAEILATASPGESTRRSGGDFAANAVIRAVGEKLRFSDAALLQQAGVKIVSVAAAQVMIFALKSETAQSVAAWLQAAIQSAGASAKVVPFETGRELAAPVTPEQADLALFVGETRQSAAVLRAAGKIFVHGIAVEPGESMGCGSIEQGSRKMPVVLVPERPESAFAAWLLLLRPCLDLCLGATERRAEAVFPLSRKIVSAPGHADLVLLRRKVKAPSVLWEPLATGDLPWQALAQAEAWHLIAPGSEGMPAGELLRAEYF
jgi:molybdopterin molybdotransferase